MVHDTKYLDKYVKLCGSRFAATIFLGQKARKLAESYDNVITHAEALSWLLSGEMPNNILHYQDIIVRREQRSLAHAYDYLTGVVDSDIRYAVEESLVTSRLNGHLVYVYGEVYNSDKQSRIRVIVNKLWYESYELDS